jgi:hypothetical protein
VLDPEIEILCNLVVTKGLKQISSMYSNLGLRKSLSIEDFFFCDPSPVKDSRVLRNFNSDSIKIIIELKLKKIF